MNPHLLEGRSLAVVHSYGLIGCVDREGTMMMMIMMTIVRAQLVNKAVKQATQPLNIVVWERISCPDAPKHKLHSCNTE